MNRNLRPRFANSRLPAPQKRQWSNKAKFKIKAFALIIVLVMLGYGMPASAALWLGSGLASASYTATNITNSYPTNVACTWATGTTVSLTWTANADTKLDGYDPMSSSTSGGSYSSLGTVSGQSATSAPAFTPASAVGEYYVVKGKRNQWRSSASAEVPIVKCPRYLNAFAGTGTSGFSGDTAAAGSAKLSAPQGTAVDSSGNVYIADTSNHRIRKVDTTGTITTIAGTGTSGFADGNATSTAQFASPTGVAVDGSGNVYIADSGNNRIRKLASGSVSTIAGTGTSGFADGNATATAQFATPTGVAVDGSGDVYIADSGNNRIRKLVSTTVSTIIGTGTAGFADGAATATAQLSNPNGVAVDGSGNVYVADTSNNRIRKLVSTTVSTIAGGASSGSTGDNAAATSALLNAPKGVAVDSANNVYIADSSNHRIRVVAGDAKIYLMAGSSSGNTGDAGLGTSATLNSPAGIAVNSSNGNVYVGDTTNNRVRALQRTSIVVSQDVESTLFGNNTPAGTSNDGQAIELGVRFTIDTPGSVTGVRFYKNALATGTHTGTLWKYNSQAMLATVTFTNETASGWQTAYFSSPVMLNPNFEYVISYFSPNGQYSYTTNYFAYDNTPLHVAASSGRYKYTGTSAFPDGSGGNTNYWVDVVFVADTTTQTFFGYSTPSNDSVDSAVTLGVRFYADIPGTIKGIRYYRMIGSTNSHTAKLWDDATTTQIATKTATGETELDWNYIPFDTPVSITANTVYVASVYFSDGRYPYQHNVFNSQLNVGNLHGLIGSNANGAGTDYATNGVFYYGNGFPYHSFKDASYFVDVAFVPS